MKNFLLVIDIQEGFIDSNTLEAKSRIDALIASGIFDCVIASVYSNYEGSPISRFMGWYGMMSADEQKVSGNARKSDYFVYKTRYSACCNELMEFLKKENGGKIPERVFVAGVDTECCVLLTAAELFEAGIKPIVMAYYCASSGGEKSHNAGLESMRSIIGESNMLFCRIDSKQDINKTFPSCI